MANMSYCRFHNTLIDFSECCDVLKEMTSGEGKRLSHDELRQAKMLADKARDFLIILSDHAGLNFEDLEDCDLSEIVGNLDEHADEFSDEDA